MTLKDKMKKNLFEEQSTTSSREQDGGTYRGAAVGEICIRGGHAVEDYAVSCRYALTPHVNIDFSIANLVLYAFAVSWLRSAFVYDKVSANIASSVPKPSKFQSGQRVVKKVQNTQHYV